MPRKNRMGGGYTPEDEFISCEIGTLTEEEISAMDCSEEDIQAMEISPQEFEQFFSVDMEHSDFALDEKSLTFLKQIYCPIHLIDVS